MRLPVCLLSLVAVMAMAGCHKDKPVQRSAPAPTPSQPAVAVNPAAAETPAAPAAPPPPLPTPGPVSSDLPASATSDKPDFDVLTGALRQYVAAHQLDPAKLTETDLQRLPAEGYIKSLPTPPAGKKYAWDRLLQVSFADK